MSAGRPSAPAPAAPFEVIIVGHQDLTPSAQLKLAGVIASRYALPAPAVAEGLAGGRCVVGKPKADAAVAHELAADLTALGARTEVHKIGASSTRADPSARTEPSAHLAPLHPLPSRPSLPAPTADEAVAAVPEKNADIVRCPIHGLSYNRARSSGCLRCPRMPHEQAQLTEQARRDQGWGWNQIRHDPVKRAVVGLALALALGLLPATIYSFGVSGGEVRRIRARQAVLSQQIGTKAIVDEFDHLEAEVSEVRHHGLFHTAIIWTLVTGIAGAGLHRLVRVPTRG
jgi:hypothetical protein